MLLGIETRQIHRDEIRTLGLEQTLRETGPGFIVRHVLVHAAGISPQRRRQFLFQSGRAQRTLQFEIVVGACAPDLRQIEGDGSTDAGGPIHIGRPEVRSGGGGPQRCNSSVLGVPIPPSFVAAEGIKRRVGVNSMLGRRRAGHECHVARIRERRQHAVNARGVGAIRDKRP